MVIDMLMRNPRKQKSLLQVVIANNYIRALKRNFGEKDVPTPYLRKHLFDNIIYGEFHKVWAIEYGISPRKVNIDWRI